MTYGSAGAHILLSSLSYLVIPAFLLADETDRLLIRSKQLLDDFNVDEHPLVSVFHFLTHLLAVHHILIVCIG